MNAKLLKRITLHVQNGSTEDIPGQPRVPKRILSKLEKAAKLGNPDVVIGHLSLENIMALVDSGYAVFRHKKFNQVIAGEYVVSWFSNPEEGITNLGGMQC